MANMKSQDSKRTQGTDEIDEFRSFNRFWTSRIGVLRAGLLDSPFSLTEARVLFEIAQRPWVDVSGVRDEVDIDPGYLSRIINKLEDQDLVTAKKSPDDARRKLLHLTEKGNAAFADLDRRSREEIEKLLTELSEKRRECALAAIRALRTLFSAGQEESRPEVRPAETGDFGWMVYRHGIVCSLEQDWDERFEARVARIVADFVDERDFRREMGWIAELDGLAAASALCTKQDDDIAVIQMLLVEPYARGRGLGTILVNECINFARRAGYRFIRAWSEGTQMTSSGLYEAAGFAVIDRETHTRFGPRIESETWELELTGATLTMIDD